MQDCDKLYNDNGMLVLGLAGARPGHRTGPLLACFHRSRYSYFRVVEILRREDAAPGAMVRGRVWS